MLYDPDIILLEYFQVGSILPNPKDLPDDDIPNFEHDRGMLGILNIGFHNLFAIVSLALLQEQRPERTHIDLVILLIHSDAHGHLILLAYPDARHDHTHK